MVAPARYRTGLHKSAQCTSWDCAWFLPPRARMCQVDLAQRGWTIKEGYTFGMPRTGDATFAAHFDQMCHAWTRPQHDVELRILRLSDFLSV